MIKKREFIWVLFLFILAGLFSCQVFRDFDPEIDAESLSSSTIPNVPEPLTTPEPNSPQNSPAPEPATGSVEMVTVLDGSSPISFVLGQSSIPGNQQSAYTVTLTRPFAIGKTETTNEIYDLFCDETLNSKSEDRGMPDTARLPVDGIRWYDILLFCNWLSIRDGLEQCYYDYSNLFYCDFSKNGYRLPTDAEWEFAARGGLLSAGYKYAGSNTAEEVAWVDTDEMHYVAEKKPNELGLYDMNGNVAEWCWDYYVSPYPWYGWTNPEGSVNLSESYNGRSTRGGGYYNTLVELNVYYRVGTTPQTRAIGLGFRLARTLN